jgi:NAD(P)-dependent dehydrogenase (short-subunit alcohol dehydrogenase family)
MSPATDGHGRLSGKVCVITGTGGSMGHATALAFAAEGASVVGCDVAVEPAESTVETVLGAGGKMVSMQPCHLDDPADCQALIELALGTPRLLPHPRGVATSEGEPRGGREHGVVERLA